MLAFALQPADGGRRERLGKRQNARFLRTLLSPKKVAMFPSFCGTDSLGNRTGSSGMLLSPPFSALRIMSSIEEDGIQIDDRPLLGVRRVPVLINYLLMHLDLIGRCQINDNDDVGGRSIAPSVRVRPSS